MRRATIDAAALAGVRGLAAVLLLVGAPGPEVARAAEPKDRAETEAALQELDETLRQLGHDAYYRYCAACHGLEGKGDGLVASALEPPPPDLTHMAARRGGEIDRQALVEIVDGRETVAAHGSREMPVWGRRLGADVADESRREGVARGHIQMIVHYLLSIQEPVEDGQGGEHGGP